MLDKRRTKNRKYNGMAFSSKQKFNFNQDGMKTRRTFPYYFYISIRSICVPVQAKKKANDSQNRQTTETRKQVMNSKIDLHIHFC